MGNKTLSDGTCCKACVKNLSPSFDGYKHATVSDIRRQIAAREENRQKLEAFQETYVFGASGCIIIDKTQRQFVALADS